MKGAIAVMDDSGDTKIAWDSDNPDEVENARASFRRLRDKGYGAFKADKKGEKSETMHDFDPNAEKIIMSPPMRGG